MPFVFNVLSVGKGRKLSLIREVNSKSFNNDLKKPMSVTNDKTRRIDLTGMVDWPFDLPLEAFLNESWAKRTVRSEPVWTSDELNQLFLLVVERWLCWVVGRRLNSCLRFRSMARLKIGVPNLTPSLFLWKIAVSTFPAFCRKTIESVCTAWRFHRTCYELKKLAKNWASLWGMVLKRRRLTLDRWSEDPGFMNSRNLTFDWTQLVSGSQFWQIHGTWHSPEKAPHLLAAFHLVLACWSIAYGVFVFLARVFAESGIKPYRQFFRHLRTWNTGAIQLPATFFVVD